MKSGKMNRTKGINRAIIKAKKIFEGNCVFCGPLYDTEITEGGHVIPRDYKPALSIGYQLSDLEENIAPACVKHHKILDNYENGRERPPFSRIRLLLQHTHEEYLSRIKARLSVLKIAFKEIV